MRLFCGCVMGKRFFFPRKKSNWTLGSDGTNGHSLEFSEGFLLFLLVVDLKNRLIGICFYVVWTTGRAPLD
jgi:hypothetical protein